MQRLKQASLAMVAFMAAMSLYFAVTLPFSPDEAHYALYGTHLDWSYFDHPPMVGWVQSFFLLFGDSELVLRIAPLLFSLVSGILLYRIVKQEFSESAAWIAVLFYASIPMFRLLGQAWVPESPLMLVGLGCLVFTLRLQKGELSETKLTDWASLGFLLGCAALSKYTAVTLAFSVALVLFRQFGLRVLSASGFWVMGAIAAVLLLPILWWNYQHDWMSFLYQLNHGAGKSEWAVFKALQMQAGQVGTYGLLTYVLGIVSTVWVLRDVERRQKFMVYLLFAWPILILFSVLAAKGRSLPHWTAMGVLFLIPVMSAWLESKWVGSFKGNLHKVWVTLLAVPSLLILLGAFAVLSGANLGYKDYQHPLQDLVGWKEVAAQTRDLAESDEEGFQQVFVPNWSHGSRYAWYARPLPAKILDTRVDQFDLWFGAATPGDSGYLVLHREKNKYHTQLLSRFEQCELKAERGADLNGVKVNHFKIYRCTNYQDVN